MLYRRLFTKRRDLALKPRLVGNAWCGSLGGFFFFFNNMDHDVFSPIEICSESAVDPREWPLRHFWVNNQEQLFSVHPYYSSSTHKWLADVCSIWRDIKVFWEIKNACTSYLTVSRSESGHEASCNLVYLIEVERERISFSEYLLYSAN